MSLTQFTRTMTTTTKTLLLSLLLSISLTFSSLTFVAAAHGGAEDAILAEDEVAIMSRTWSNGLVTVKLADGDILMTVNLVPFPKGGIKTCKLVFDVLKSRKIVEHVDAKIEFLGRETWMDLVDTCKKASHGSKGSKAITVPGTKWCGPGDNAKHRDDLGERKNLDMCCRDHDLCPYNIKAFKTRDFYWNSRPHTVSGCDCDEAFFDCVKNVKDGDGVAWSVGLAFFNTVGPPCVKKEHGTYCKKWHWMGMWCEETATGEAAIGYKYLDGKWKVANSVKEVKEQSKATPIPPM